MKTFCIIILSIVSLVIADFYSPRYDDFDIQPLLENDRILLGYVKCFLDEGPCTPEAKDFKKVIPEALQTTCGKCTSKQKELIRTVIRAIIQDHPESWEQLIDKFDKEKKYKDAFDKFLADKNE
ncbi:hypothetical protein K1T71_010247 [Dendrolimus kikuchii]|uniref:Uncharacterized protein n=2 Tax=Dendrolimus kikuchii TaxID=765133 RepID=A0ACC1CR82_9NEOP|nr:chemosensory protein [Dendrolimus kikuchii]KAJ0174101.1 hypothetical protein K1T71_010247 [Dendrolimus kikuchii]